MKKLLAIVLLGAMVLSLASCGSKSGTSKTETEETTTETEATTSSISFHPDFTFKTTDRDGNEYDEHSFTQYKLTMIVFCEAYCEPGCDNLPELEQLYEKYKDQGFMVFCVYKDTSLESEIDSLIEKYKITFPFLHYESGLDEIKSRYIPSNSFITGTGRIYYIKGEKYLPGTYTTREWEMIISQYMPDTIEIDA